MQNRKAHKNLSRKVRGKMNTKTGEVNFLNTCFKMLSICWTRTINFNFLASSQVQTGALVILNWYCV